MQPEWRIEMLGTLRAVHGDRTIDRFRTRRVASLLAYLAFHRDRVHSRDALADLLWPDIDFQSARRNLRQALFSLRQSFGSSLLSANDGVQLDPAVFTTDIEQFERQVGAGEFQKAVQTYKGPLLPSLRDEWIAYEQVRLEELYLHALGELGRNEPDPMTAIGYLRAALKLEPDNERLLAALTTRSEGVRNTTTERRLSLPTIANRLFGRAREIEAVCEFLEEGRARMVTILGPAGVGKTRLATECGHAIASRQSWDVLFVPLADRLNAAEIYEAIATVLEANSFAHDSEVSAIVRQTEGRPTLLILDNLEQIADEAGPYIAKLLAAGKNLVCLGTSRQSLQIQEEQLFPLETLPLPADGSSTVALESIPSVQLFLDRCQAIRPDLVLNDENAGAIAGLCVRFDGLPLAIEIAAGLSSTFSPTQMAQRLPLAQTEIVNRRKDAPERHRTLKAAIEWSFLSMREELYRLFLNLSVFRGGFSLNAAQAVCFDGQDGIVEAVNALIERSLVRRSRLQDLADPRFELLTAFREHAENETSETAKTALLEAHAEYFASRTPPDRPLVSVEEQTTVHLEIEADYENFLSAAEHSFACENLDRCVRLLSILSTRWLTQGPKVAERDLIRRLSRHPKIDRMAPGRRILLLRMMGTTYIRSAEYQAAYECCQTALQIAEQADDSELIATCFSALSVCAGYLGRQEECLELSRKALTIAGDENLILAERSHLGIGSILWDQGELEKANREFIVARRLSEKLRGGEPDALIVINQAEIALGLSDVDAAARFAHEAIKISKRLRDGFTLAMALSVVGRCQTRRGEYRSAAATNLEALDRFRKGDFVFWTLKSLRNHALILTHMGCLAEAATLLSVTSEVSSGQKAAEASDESAALETIRAGLTSDEFEAALARGLGMNAEEAFQFLSHRC